MQWCFNYCWIYHYIFSCVWPDTRLKNTHHQACCSLLSNNNLTQSWSSDAVISSSNHAINCTVDLNINSIRETIWLCWVFAFPCLLLKSLKHTEIHLNAQMYTKHAFILHTHTTCIPLVLFRPFLCIPFIIWVRSKELLLFCEKYCKKKMFINNAHTVCSPNWLVTCNFQTSMCRSDGTFRYDISATFSLFLISSISICFVNTVKVFDSTLW